MRVRSLTALVAVFLAGAPAVLPAAAQDLPLRPPPPVFAPVKPPQPFGNLFGRQRPMKLQRPTLPKLPSLNSRTIDLAAQQRQTIVCGMRLVPADPKFDAAMRRAVPENGPAFTLRTAPPPVCRQ